jgi:hypothetical protein
MLGESPEIAKPRRLRLRGRRTIVLAVGSALSISLMSPAFAAWVAMSDPGSSASSVAKAMPGGNQPAAASPAASSTVNVSWAASAGDVPVEGYDVRSYDAATGTPRTVGGSCVGLVTGTSCTESGVPDGSWRYSVVPRREQWSGAESPLSDPVVVDTSYQALVLSESPGAYWRLGESTGTTAVDETGTSDGTYAGGHTLAVPGALADDPNTAVDVDGSSGRISAPSVPALDLTSEVTM